jgi:preprotein translocase subunit SecG
MRFTLRRYLILISTLLAAAATAAPAALPVFASAKPAGSPLPAAVQKQLQQQLQAQAAQPTPPPPQTFVAMHAPWLTHGLAGLFVLAAVGLVFLLAIQTTKQEGLTGSIGGRVSSDFRGGVGMEEQLKRITGVTAVVFVVTAFILSLTGI